MSFIFVFVFQELLSSPGYVPGQYLQPTRVLHMPSASLTGDDNGQA